MLGFGKTNLQEILTSSYVVKASAYKITFKLTKMCQKTQLKALDAYKIKILT
jgi:hypothetical protein